MKLFWKIFAAVFITFVAAVSIISYLITIKQIAAAEHGIVEKYTLAGEFISREIELHYAESRWPFDRLKGLAQQQGFLFWWVVRDDGVIHLADRAEIMGTYARDYLPQVKPGDTKESLILNRGKNYGLFLIPLEIGKKQWSLWLGFSLTQIREIKHHIIFLSLLVALAALVGLGTILYLAIKHFLKPIDDLSLGADAIGHGNLSHRVEIRSGDELGRLADAFNKMATDLQMTTVSRDYVDSILETMLDALIVVDVGGRIITSNRAACLMLGYNREELIGAPAAMVFGSDQPLGPNLEKLVEAGELTNWEVGYQAKDGRQVPVLFSGSVRRDEAGQISHIVCTAMDLTQRKLAEEALVESERRFRDIAENSAEWIWEVDSSGRYTYASPVAEGLLGYKSEELLEKHFYDLFHPEDREELKGAAFTEFAARRPFRDFINRNIRKDGQIVWVSTSGVPILDEAGNLRGYRGADIDITARRQAMEALVQSERFLANIFDSIQDGLTILDTDYHIIRVNPFMERQFSHAMPLVAKKCYKGFHDADQPCEDCPARRTIETGQADFKEEGGFGERGEITGWLEIRTFPMVDAVTGKVKGVIEYIRDVTQQKQAEEALRRSEDNLRQSQKMEAVGRLAGGVAHDFNNILTAIIGYCELLRVELPFADPHFKDLEEIRQAAERAASLTRQLLAFSRKQIFAPKVLNLNELVMNLDKMLRRLVSEDIKLVTVPAESLGEVMADPGQIEQVILNLVVNARDAMPDGGVITIGTSNTTLDENYNQKYGDVQTGPYVMLAVSDTGAGMDEASRVRIFEPFFTTKELGKGTGLGLSTVHGIIKQSGGHITVYSEVGQGTTFKIYLPRLSQSEGNQAAAPASCPFDHGTETILLVEDEDMVRHVARRILEINGYTVLEAASGQDALAVSQRAAGTIHLMLTDVVMPGISGGETAQMLKAQRPDLKVLFMSGHTENSIVHHGVLDSEVAFLQKPFKGDVLARKVREVLDGSPPLHG